MNWNNYKYIITSGCSYSVLIENTLHTHVHYEKIHNEFNKLEKSVLGNGSTNTKIIRVNNDDTIININVGLPSQTSEWILHSSQYTIQKLIEFGVDPKNIYCFVEWTQYNRHTLSHENFIKLSDVKLNNLIKIYSTDINLNINFIENEFKFATLDELPNVGVIQNKLYLTANQLTEINFKNLPMEWQSWYENGTINYNKTSNLELLTTYLNNIISLQSYLKSLNIKYNFCNMQSEFSGWIEKGLEYEQKIKLGRKYHPYYLNSKDEIIYNSQYIETIKLGESVENVYPQITHLYNLIDFTNWWYYESDNCSRGGIDEYMFDTYGIHAYTKIKNDTQLPTQEFIGGPNWHPIELLYTLLHNKICFNNPFFKINPKWITFINDKLNEDINYDGISKNNLTYSAKHINNFIKYESK
jgi:hypothetical protein